MEKLYAVKSDGASLPVCLIRTDYPELGQMIEAMFFGRFAFSDGDSPDLLIEDADGGIRLTVPGRSASATVERPVTVQALLEAVDSLTSPTSSHGFYADAETSSAVLGDSSVRLTETEFRLFSAIVDAGGRYVTAADLSEAVWGKYDRNLCTVYLSYLRRKLDGTFGDGTLLTARGKGYRLRLPDSHE